jgi:Tfp pilus assembly protein PilX
MSQKHKHSKINSMRNSLSRLLRPRNLRLSQVQGSQEKRARRIANTLSELRTQLTRQLAKSDGSASGFARRQAVTAQDSRGMASIVIVTVLVVIMTMISIGFARIMNRSIINSANRQASSAATYAAQSAINDVSSFVKLAGNGNAYSDKCNGPGSLIGDSTTKGPFYYDSNLSGDTSKSTHYTCLLLNQTPTSLQYQQIASNKSRVVKATTSAFKGSVNKYMVSWQSSSGQVSGFPASSSRLFDETTWGDASHNYVPVLRVTLYPVPESGDLTNVQARSKTVFLYPQHSVGNVKSLSYDAIVDGSLIPVGCVDKNAGESATVGSGDFSGTADYNCNVIFSNLVNALKPDADKIDYFYLRITPIYGAADVQIKANDMWDQSLQFVGVQAVVDATATAGSVAKRLQARVDISSVTAVNNEQDNISSANDSIPEAALRTASAICKRIIQTQSVYSYVTFDQPANVCHDTTSVDTKDPSMIFSISGQDWPLNGSSYSSLTRDSADVTPAGSSQYGTIYIPYSGSSTINWNINDSTSCSANWGAPPSLAGQSNNTGSKGFSGITSVTNYTLQCQRVGSGNDPSTTKTISKTVTAWPWPRASVSVPQLKADTTVTVSWSSANATRCNLRGDWADLNDHRANGSQQISIPWWDKSTKHFAATCFDPVNRWYDTATGTEGWGTPPTDLGPGYDTTAPDCTAWADVVDSGNGTGYVRWNGSCPQSSPGSGWYNLHSSTDGSWNINGVGNAAEATWLSVGPGHHCVGLAAGADPWGQLADTAGNNGNENCRDIDYPPVSVTLNVPGGLHFQDPQCNSPGNYWDNSWDCGGSADGKKHIPGPCSDFWHSMTVCSSSWSASQSGSGYFDITCKLYASGDVYIGVSSYASGSTGKIGWNSSYPELKVVCTGKGGKTGSDSW